MNQSQALEFFLTKDRFVNNIRAEDRSRLLNQIRMLRFDTDHVIYNSTTTSKNVYFVVEGKVSLYANDTQNSSPPLQALPEQYFGQEVAMESEHYIHKAVAYTPVTLIQIPAEQFSILFQKHPRTLYHFVSSLLTRFTAIPPHNRLFATTSVYEDKSYLSMTVIAKWLTFMAIVLALYLFRPMMALDEPTVIFISLAVVAISLWGLDLMPPYVPAILVVTVLLTTDIAKPSVVLSGFTSEPFFIALTTYALGCVITASGFLYRVMLIVLKYMPQSQRWSKSCLFMVGIVLNLTIPSSTKRQHVMQSSLQDMLTFTHQSLGTAASNTLAITSFTGSTLFNAVFLSGSLLNFIMLGFLSPQDQLRFQWSGWLQTASIVGSILFIVHLAIIIVGRQKANQDIVIDRSRIDHQHRVLGSMSLKEWGAITALLVFIIGTLTADMHRLPPTMMGLFILLFLTALNIVDKDMFHKHIDWPSLFFLAVIIGFYNTMAHLNINMLMVHHLSNVGEFIKNNFMIFIVILAFVLVIMRLIMPFAPTALLASWVLIPLAQEHEMSPWIMCFLALLFARMGFFAYQFPWLAAVKKTYIQHYDRFEKQFLTYNAALVIIKIIAVIISVPFWIKLGLI